VVRHLAHRTVHVGESLMPDILMIVLVGARLAISVWRV
jgi:hypothetical protein